MSCAFCERSDEDEITGELERTRDGRIVAHYNCMIYSPRVISKDSQEDTEGFHFNIHTVQHEIERGQNLPCNLCKKRGATVGCDVESCRRTYHYPCVQKANGSSTPHKYVVYCAEHKHKKTSNGSKDIHVKTKRCTQRKRKRLQKTAGKLRKNNIKKNIKKLHDNKVAMQNVETDEQSEANFILAIHSTVQIEDCEEAVPSTSGQNMGLDTSSEESDSILSPKVKAVYSLSGFPKRKKMYNSNRKRNEELDEVLQTMSSEDKAALSQIYSELGGSQQSFTIEMTANQDNQNDKMTAADALDSDVTDTSTCSGNPDIDKTPERLPDIDVHASPSRCSTEEKDFIGEQPCSSRIEETPVKTSASFPKRRKMTLNDELSKLSSTQSSGSSIEDRSCMCTLHASSYSANVTGNSSMAHPLCMLDDGKLPTQQIHSSNRKEKFTSQVSHCTDASKSTKPGTSQGCSLDFLNVVPAKDPGAQETSETDPSGDLSVTEPESTSCPTLILQRDGNKAEVSTSVRDASPEKMEDDLSASLPFSGEIPSSSIKTLQSKQSGQNSRTISKIVSPTQIRAFSRGLVTGIFSKQLRSFVPQIQSAIESPKGNTAKNAEHSRDGQATSQGSPKPSTKDQPIQSAIESPKGNTAENAEHSRDGQATSEGSPKPSTKDQPAGSYLREPLENQKHSCISNEKKDLVCQERSKSMSPRINLFKELFENMKHQKREENLHENLEIPQKQVESNFKENALLKEAVTPGSVESKCASEHQPGPSRMVRPYRRQLCGSLQRRKRRSGFQRVDLDDLDGFGRAVAGQCRLMPQDRQTKYMSYVLASAHLFCTHPTLPKLDILITNLETVLERSQQSTLCSSCGS